MMARWRSKSRPGHCSRKPRRCRPTHRLTGVGGLGDVTPCLLDAVGDRVTGRNPLPRADRALGIQSGHLIQASLIGLHQRCSTLPHRD